MSQPDFEIERHCSCDKKPGIIQLSSTLIVWTPDSAAHGSEVRIAYSNIKNFQVSKEGAAKKAMIRITYADRAEKVTFDFGNRFSDRDSVRDVLNSLQRRSTATAATAATAATNALSEPESQSQNNHNEKEKAKPAAPPTPKLTKEEVLRRTKIMAHKEVRKLHKQLVNGNVISDEVFWNAMKWRYKDNGEPRGKSALDTLSDDENDDDDDNSNESMMNENSMMNKKSSSGIKGIPSDAFQPIDDSTNNNKNMMSKSNSNWESVIPSSSERHLVFMEKPAVARAFKVKVIEKKVLTEHQFWTLFISSSLAGRQQKKMSKSDTTKTAQADAIFAPFETNERQLSQQEELEHIKSLAHELNLDHADDHRSIHVQDQHRMQGDIPREMTNIKRRRLNSINSKSNQITSSGGNSEGLRLMKLVNKHGNLLLAESGIGSGWQAVGVDKERPLDDLEIEETTQVSKLGFKSNDQNNNHGNGILGLLERGKKPNSSNPVVSEEDCEQLNDWIASWQSDVSRFRQHVDGNDKTLSAMLGCMRP